MYAGKFLFTSESVTEGHPDKICDQISDAVLDTLISQDPGSRVACEAMIGTGFIHVAGEITTKGWANFDEIARNVTREIGYTHSDIGFDADNCAIMLSINKQSGDISQGVTEGEGLYKEQGAGDQGMMFGYACNENEDYMPSPIYYAHKLTRRLAETRRQGTLNFLRPDGKSQVTVEYVNGKPTRIDAVIISAQHSPDVTYEKIRESILDQVVKPSLPAQLLDSKTKYFINPTGRFVVGGPHGDCGLTGRKIIVDTYGGWGRHGGGSFSGKDPSKVDRSASYMARYVAKNVVAAGLAEHCEIQVAYAIGVAEPVSVMVNSFGTGKISDEKLGAVVREIFTFKPKSIIQKLQLLRPIYRKTASYGHFGRASDGFSWEQTDMVDAVRKAAG
ncbi:MAG TPA: methionine adenosyltransferase [Bdellovibrionota bacterium]|nr:methionine adenosyltransferase [Bdellovibrionota bacterium]